ITAETFPSGVKAIWLLTVTHTCGCALAGAAAASPNASPTVALRQFRCRPPIAEPPWGQSAATKWRAGSNRVEPILTRHGSMILKAIGSILRHGALRSACTVHLDRGFVPDELRISWPPRAPRLARPGRERMLRPQAGHPFRHHRRRARNRRSGHLRHDASAKSLGGR